MGLEDVAQATGYWCGPASAYMALAYKGAWTYPGDPNRQLLQTNLAEDLQTTEEGTIWWYVPGVLNDWIDESWYINTEGPSASNVLYYTSLDYADYYPVIYDTHMSSAHGWLEGWSSLWGANIYHYVAGDGYDNGESKVHYYDPYGGNEDAFGSHWWPASTMASVMSDLGMTW